MISGNQEREVLTMILEAGEIQTNQCFACPGQRV